MAAITLGYGVIPRRPPLTWAAVRRVLLLAALLISCEVACARLAYYTLGEIDSGVYFVLVGLNVLAVGAILISPRVTVIGLLLLAVLIIPYQGLLGLRWWRAHREAQQIIAWAAAAKAQTGSYPPSLQGYTFRDRGISPYFSYQLYEPYNVAQSYGLGYHIGTTSTAHTYSPTGGWFYYPD